MKRTVSLALIALVLALMMASAGVPVTNAAPAVCTGDIALGKTAHSDTVNATFNTRVPANAVDGVISDSSIWQSANTVNTSGEHFWVDLGSSTNFTGIEIDWWQAATSFTLESSDDASSWTTLSSNPGIGPNNITKWTGNATARYVRVSASHTNTLDGTIGMYEFKVVSPTACATNMTVSSSPNPSVYGQSITITALLTASDGSAPQGTVAFDVDGNPIAACTAQAVTAGKATCLLSSPISVGLHTIHATFTASTGWLTSNNSVVQTVNPASTKTLVTSNNPSVAGQPVTFTATVSALAPGSGAPGGTVDFSITGIGTVCSAVAVSGGQALCTPASPLMVGQWSVQASYSGNASYNASTGGLTQTVGKASTITTVTTVPALVNPGNPVTLTAQIAVVSPGVAVSLGGTVKFMDNGVIIPSCGLVAVSSLKATCGPLTYANGGTHTITAIYSGDANYKTSRGSIPGGLVVRWTPKMSVHIMNSRNVVITSAVPGTVVHDNAVLSGGHGTPTGTVTFTLYYGTTCSGAVAQQTLSLVSGAASSGVATQMSTGISFQVSYSGDAMYAPITPGACQALPTP
ncbi:MAG: Ig-like domain repeat protein [Anaerolineae bacterium]